MATPRLPKLLLFPILTHGAARRLPHTRCTAVEYYTAVRLLLYTVPTIRVNAAPVVSITIRQTGRPRLILPSPLTLTATERQRGYQGGTLRQRKFADHTYVCAVQLHVDRDYHRLSYIDCDSDRQRRRFHCIRSGHYRSYNDGVAGRLPVPADTDSR